MLRLHFTLVLHNESGEYQTCSFVSMKRVQCAQPISGDKLMDVRYPQHRAAQLVSDKDPMQMDLNDPLFEQQYIMTVFYYSLDGDNWSSSDGWLSGESECSWE
jgi:hypothetical protein